VTAVSDLQRLRSHRIKLGFGVALASRVFKLGAALVMTGAIIRRLGDVSFGLIALAAAAFELVTAFDLAIHELVTFEVASTDTRDDLEHRLSQALWTSLVPGLGGALVLAGLAALAGLELTRATVGHGLEIRSLVLVFAVTYPFTMVASVYTGNLLGFGYVSELNAVLVAGVLLDVAIVLLGLHAGLGLVALQWARGAATVLQPFILYAVVRARGLPTPRLRRPQPASLKRMLRFGVGYSTSKALGDIEYACDIPIAQFFVGPAALAGYAAADQWAGKLYRFSHVLFESLYPRLVRCFRAAASAEERARGASLYVAANLFVVAVVVPAAVGLVALGPWLFQVWLGQDRGPGLDLLPWLAASWALNAVGSPSSCVILASGKFRQTVIPHLIAVALNVVGDVVLGSLYGMSGVVVATAVSNALLTLMLMRAGAALSGVGSGALAMWTLPPILAGTACVAAARAWGMATGWGPALTMAALITAVSAALASRSPDVRRAWAAMRSPTAQL